MDAMARPARCHRIVACRSRSGTSRRIWRTSALVFGGARGSRVPRSDQGARAREIRPDLPARPARVSLSVRAHPRDARGGVRGPARQRADEGRRRDRRAEGMGRGARPARHVARLRGRAGGPRDPRHRRRPTSARTRARTSTGSATGGLTSSAVRKSRSVRRLGSTATPMELTPGRWLDRLGWPEWCVRLFGVGRFRVLHAGAIACRQLRDGVEDLPVLAPRADHEDHTRSIACADAHVLSSSRTVEVVPLPQQPLVTVDEQPAFPREDDNRLLLRLGVVEAVRLARLQDSEIDLDLLKPRVLAVEPTNRTQRLRAEPPRVPHIRDKPTAPVGATPEPESSSRASFTR